MKKQNRVAFFNILSTVLLNGIALFTAPIFSRLLPDSSYGLVSICNVWSSIIAIVFTLQTQGTLVNARVEFDEEKQRRYHSSALTLSICVYTLCSAFVLAFLGPVAGLLKLPKILVVMILVQAFGTFCINYLNTKYVYEFKAGRNMFMSLGVTLTALTLSLIFVLSLPEQQRHFGRIGALALTYGGIGTGACVYMLVRGKTFYNREFWKFCIVLAIPSVFYNLSDLLLGQSDQVMIQQMLGASAAGQYGLAWKLGNVMFILFAALNKTWMPFFFEDMKNGDGEKVWAKAANFLEVFTVLSVGFILLSREVYHVFADREYWSSTGIIPLFVASYFIGFLCTFPVNYEYYRKKTKVVAVVTIISALVNIGLNWVLIQKIGMAGAALATVLSHGLQLTMHYGYNRFVLGKGEYPFGFRLWGKYAAGFAAMVVFVYATEGLWLVRWGVGACIGVWELTRIKKRKVLI